MSKPYVVLGGGGHASILCDIVLSQGNDVEALVSPRPIDDRSVFSNIKHITTDEEFFVSYDKKDVMLINGIGALPNSYLRKQVAEKFTSKGFLFAQVIDSSAIISKCAKLDGAVQVLQGAVVQCGVSIGEHSIINTRASIDHDCHIGEQNHVAPGATLCGEVNTEDNVYIGAGATIIQGCSIGSHAVIGAGATVTKCISSGEIVYPARSLVKVKA